MPTIVLVFTISFDVLLMTLGYALPYLMVKLIDKLLNPTDKFGNESNTVQ